MQNRYYMPDVSGIELLESIRASNPELPVILMTAYADMDKAVEAIKKGAFDFIVKPYNIEQLIHSVEKAVKYRRLTELEKDYKRTLEEMNQELETLIAERTMGLMALTIADKLRNPATVIGGLCKRLIEKEGVSDRLMGNLKNIMNEAEKLEGIVKDFETLLKSRRSIFKYEDINKIVEAVISVVKMEAEEKGLKLETSLPGQALSINAERNLLSIAILQIIRNAVEASSEGGRVAAAVREEGNNAVLIISDTGSGISREDINNIFDPFFSTKAQRFGMGLPLAKQIISEHLGEIKVESEPGKGTTLKIILPLRWMEKQ
jgi:signal transduction histidine kinase